MRWKEEGAKEGTIDGWMDEKSWHGVREHLIGEFWVILLTMEPPSQAETLVQIESESADKARDVWICVQSVVLRRWRRIGSW